MPFMSGVHQGGHGRQTRSSENGQALVELALILPFLLLLIFGVLDLGKALGYKNDQTNLADVGARLAVVSAGTACKPCTPGQTIDQYIVGTAPAALQSGGSSPATVTFTFPNFDPSLPGNKGYCTGDPVKVTVTSTYRFLKFLFGSNVTHPITTSATMRMESDYPPGAATRFTTT